MAERVCSVPWISCKETENTSRNLDLLDFPEPNDANATGSLSTHYGCIFFTSSSDTNERSEPVSNITVASVTPRQPRTVTRANCSATDGGDFAPGGAVCATETFKVIGGLLDDAAVMLVPVPVSPDGGPVGGTVDEAVGATIRLTWKLGPQRISWWRPPHFLHKLLHPLEIWPDIKQRKHKPAALTLSLRTWTGPLLSLKHFSVGWFFPQKLHLGFAIDEVCNAAVVGVRCRRSSLGNLLLTDCVASDSWNICDLSRRWISLSRTSSK